MAHNEGPRPQTSQALHNASFSFSVSAFNTSDTYTYLNISTSAQTLVKTGAGALGKIALQSTLISAVKVYDNTVSGGNVLAYIPASTSAGTVFDYRERFVNGLVVSSGGGADTFNVIFN